jgi:hypothetical protein
VVLGAPDESPRYPSPAVRRARGAVERDGERQVGIAISSELSVLLGRHVVIQRLAAFLDITGVGIARIDSLCALIRGSPIKIAPEIED